MTDGPEIGALDPVAAFEQTLNDMVNVVKLFADDDSPMTAEDFLHATRAAGERLKAISMFTMAGILSPVAHKVSPEVRREFEEQIALEEMNLTDEERQRRMLKALRNLATMFNTGR